MLNERSLNINLDFVKFIRCWIPVIIWLGIIFWMSTNTFSSEQSSQFVMPVIHFLFNWLSPQGTDLMHQIIRKFGHIAVYFVFGLLLFRAFCGESSQRWNLRWMVYSVILIIFVAMSDEFHQSFVASRTSSPFDVAIDSAGGIFSQLAILFREKTFGLNSE